MPINLSEELDLESIPEQGWFYKSKASRLLYSGAFGAGKTYVLCEKALLLSRHPNNFGVICRKQFSDLRLTTMWTWLNDVCPSQFILNWNKSESVMRLRNNSIIAFIGLDKATKLGSLNLGWVAIDEAIETKEEDWNMLEGRLRLANVPERQIFAATNPGAPTHYLYQKFYRDGLGEIYHSDTLHNPWLPEDYIDRLETFKGRYHDRYVLGKWVQFEGMVYDLFNPAIHVINPFKIPKEWKRIRCVDFGYTNPFVCQWWAIDPDDNWYLYREIYKTHRLVEDHAKTILRYSGEEKYIATWADHDAEDAATLRKHGVPTLPAKKDVGQGIQACYEKFIPKGNGKPSIYFFRNALREKDQALEFERKPTCTVDELLGYRWNEEKDEPVKEYDHGCDCMRYGIYTYKIRRGGLLVQAV